MICLLLLLAISSTQPSEPQQASPAPLQFFPPPDSAQQTPTPQTPTPQTPTPPTATLPPSPPQTSVSQTSNPQTSIPPSSAGNAPTPLPPSALIARPVPIEYAFLLSHSMFVRGHQAIDTHHEGIVHPPTSAPSAMPSDSSLVSKPEDSLIFNGVTASNGVYEAFIEDTSNQSVKTVRVGEAISQGRVTEITLDSLSYTNAQHTMHLHIGQNLSGGEATAPPIATSNPSDVPITGDSVADRMRRKRQLELLGH